MIRYNKLFRWIKIFFLTFKAGVSIPPQTNHLKKKTEKYSPKIVNANRFLRRTRNYRVHFNRESKKISSLETSHALRTSVVFCLLSKIWNQLEENHGNNNTRKIFLKYWIRSRFGLEGLENKGWKKIEFRNVIKFYTNTYFHTNSSFLIACYSKTP